MGLAARYVGFVLPLGGIPSRTEWSQAFGVDDSPRRPLQDFADSRKFRGSAKCSQWRISAWEVMLAGSNSSIPAGRSFQGLFRALVSSNSADPRCVSLIIDGSQPLDDARGPHGGENPQPALTFRPIRDCDGARPQPTYQRRDTISPLTPQIE